MGKIKVSNVRRRRNLAGAGALISLIPIVGVILLPILFSDNPISEIFISGAFLLLVVGFPLSMLLLTRYNRTLRRAREEYIQRKS